MNHYEVLGVSKTASFAEIKSSFRKKVKLVHPDLNPGKDRTEFIRLNEAYEVLSDATSRNLYNLYLDGVQVKTEIEEVTPQQRYREQYRMRKAKEAREHLEAQILYKQKFYAKLRYVNFSCFFLALLLTYDYYEESILLTVVPHEVEYRVSNTRIVFADGRTMLTRADFHADYVKAAEKQVELTSSPILSIPKRIKVTEMENSYAIRGSVYMFGNAIAMLLFAFSIVVIANKPYSDSRLTFGIFSVVILVWMIAMVLIFS